MSKTNPYVEDFLKLVLAILLLVFLGLCIYIMASVIYDEVWASHTVYP